MSKAFVTSPRKALVPTRDIERLEKRGWVVAPDYEEREVLAVYEVDPGKLTSKVVGLVTKKEHLKRVQERVETGYSKDNKLIRLKDLMDIKALSFRTGRAKATIVGTWTKWEDWPDPIGVYGGSKVYFWPDVLACMERHGLRVRKEGHPA